MSDVESALRRSDPELESEMASLHHASSGSGSGSEGSAIPLDRVLQTVAICVIVLVLVPREWMAWVVSIGVLLALPTALVIVAIRAEREGLGFSDQRDDGGERHP